MNAGTDTRRLRTLAAMGIDVWVRRGRAQVTEAAAPLVRPIERPAETPAAKIEPAPVPSRAPSSESPATAWTAVGVGKVVLLARLDAPHDRRFAQDLVLAASDYPDETPALVTFAPTRAGGEEIAAFARGQIDRRRAERAIVSRSAAVALALRVDDAPGIGVTKLHGAHCLVVPDIEALRSSPDAKRKVWQALRRLP